MTIIYSMDTFYTLYVGSSSISNTSTLSSGSNIIHNGKLSVTGESTISASGTTDLNGSAEIDNTSLLNIDGNIVIPGELSVTSGSVLIAEGTDLMLLGSANLNSTSFIDIPLNTSSAHLFNDSSLKYNVLYGDSSILSISSVTSGSNIEIEGTFFNISESLVSSSGNIIHDGKTIIIGESELSASSTIIEQVTGQEINNDATLTATSTLGYYKYGSLSMVGTSNISTNGILELFGYQEINSGSSIDINSNILYDGKTNIISESNIVSDGQYINKSIYGNSEIHNDSLFVVDAETIITSNISITNESTLYSDSIVGKEEHGQLIANGVSSILVEGIIPIRQNINCGIIQIVNLNNITITNEGSVQKIINDKPINIKNC